MRKAHSVSNGNREVKVYWDTDWEEYISRLYIDGVLIDSADYFTNDWQDAIDTAALMVKANELVCYME